MPKRELPTVSPRQQKESFLQSLRDDPDDETTRLVFADWLEDHGEPKSADEARKGPLSDWRMHVLRWSDCDRCVLKDVRTKVVLGRGKVPCDVLLVGEAPGSSEDVIGQPFIGPAGKHLDNLIAQSVRQGPRYEELRFAWTNIVACIPKGADGTKAKEPEFECIQACRPRLEEMVVLARPRLLVAVGAVARDYTMKGDKYCARIPAGTKMVTVDHPAHILRANVAQQGLLNQRVVVILSNAFEELFE